MTFIAVVVAGIAGALARFAVSQAFLSRPGFPWAVLVVNIVGSAFGGVILASSATVGLSNEWRLILLTGFCGGLTTFSTFSVENVQLVIAGKGRTAVISILANVIGAVGAAVLGWVICTAALAGNR